VQINGECWQDDARRIFLPTHQRALGYVFQEASLFAHLSVRANLEFGLKRIPAAERKVGWDAALGCWASAICWNGARSACPAASASGWRSPGPCSPARACC
jgi:ABC-type uncharacterized transport system YnjBCD ATPase subunit